MEILCWVYEKYSGKALSNGEVHQFSHAIPDILELADIQRDGCADALHIGSGYELFYANLSSNC